MTFFPFHLFGAMNNAATTFVSMLLGEYKFSFLLCSLLILLLLYPIRNNY